MKMMPTMIPGTMQRMRPMKNMMPKRIEARMYDPSPGVSNSMLTSGV